MNPIKSEVFEKDYYICEIREEGEAVQWIYGFQGELGYACRLDDAQKYTYDEAYMMCQEYEGVKAFSAAHVDSLDRYSGMPKPTLFTYTRVGLETLEQYKYRITGSMM